MRVLVIQRKKGLALASAVVVALAFVALFMPSRATAQETGGRVAFDRDLVVAEGEVVQGDVSVTNGDLVVQGEVRGNVVVLGGDADIEGKISGDLTVIGGKAALEDTSYVGGNVAAQEVSRAEGATIKGRETIMDMPVPLAPLKASLNMPGMENSVGRASGTLGSVERVLSILVVVVLGAIVMLLSIGVAAFVPQRLQVAESTLQEAPGPSLIVGLITAFLFTPAVALVGFVLTVSVVGIILLPLLLLGVALALLFGLVVVCQWLGKRLYETPHPRIDARAPIAVVQVVVGMAVVLGSTLLPAPFLPGWAVAMMLGLIYFLSCVGLGALTLSRFGTLLPPRRATHAFAYGTSAYEAPRQPAATAPLGPAPVLPEIQSSSQE